MLRGGASGGTRSIPIRGSGLIIEAIAGISARHKKVEWPWATCCEALFLLVCLVAGNAHAYEQEGATPGTPRLDFWD